MPVALSSIVLIISLCLIVIVTLQRRNVSSDKIAKVFTVLLAILVVSVMVWHGFFSAAK